MCKCRKSCNKIFTCVSQLERKHLKILITIGDFIYKVSIVQCDFSKFVFGDNINLGTIFSVGWKLLLLQTCTPTIIPALPRIRN